MSKHNTRNRVKSISDSCVTCDEKILKNESSFDCFVCGCRMHLTKNFTGPSEAAVNGVLAIGKNALLLCNKCIEEKRHEKLAQPARVNTVSNEHQESQVKNPETEMTELKKTVSEIKTLLTRKPPDSGQPAQNSPITKSQEQMPKPTEELDGIRIRGIPESTEKEARVRQEHDLAEAQKLLTHMEVNAIIGDVIRFGRYEEILLKVPNAYQRRMVLLSARKLKTFTRPIFLSKQLTKDEADLENLALVRRRELINEGADPKNLRVRDATLFIRQGAKWTKEKLPVADE